MTSSPIVLGFDTSLAHCGAAVFSGGDVVAAKYEDMTKGQAERLIPMIAETLQEAGLSKRDVTAIGVGIGPGNFTGIRISVSAARSMALALGIPAIGVSLLEALAEGSNAPVLASIDARRDHVYLQRFADGANRGPELVAFTDIGADWAVPGLICQGNRANDLGNRLKCSAGPTQYAPASAIARIAARRAGTNQPRPAPLYLRPADAAPARDKGPVILS